MKLAFVGAKIITPFRCINPGTIIISGKKIFELGKIDDVEITSDCTLYDASGMIVTPGFVDLLCHGGSGKGFADEDDPKALSHISNFHFSHGTTTLLAGLYSKPYTLLINDMRRIAHHIENSGSTNLFGIHMEGPYINPKHKGAMNEEYLWKPDLESWYNLRDSARGYIKIMTIAPELPGCLPIMRHAAQDRIVLSIGHSEADYDEIEAAIDNGASHVTHIFNAMRPMHHREPGVVTASFLRDELKIELIADGIHVHPVVMKLIYKLKGTRGINLITDAIRACGMSDGEYEFADQKVIVKDKKAYLEDGTLAGSTLTMDEAIKNMIELVGVPPTDAIRMASLNGAKVLGLQRSKGILAAGMDADIVLMNPQFEVLVTLREGKVKFSKLSGLEID
ncbi:MAG: N-acetylglucosamine-6-phosphate deacetylase [Bacteroidetes bacterium]|nr:N-acetylglucosamine-6-phosphate deacetylase [Bacteroidota bacterium]MBU2585404.1 N-acetylglucosamine-6-phosphate deacetylase [Bacteroidota bacterium]